MFGKFCEILLSEIFVQVHFKAKFLRNTGATGCLLCDELFNSGGHRNYIYVLVHAFFGVEMQ